MSKAASRRLAALEQSHHTGGEILVCWCAREDGQCEPECPCYGKTFDIVVRWPDAEASTPAPAR